MSKSLGRFNFTADGRIITDAELKDQLGSHPKGVKISEDGDHRLMVWQGDNLVATYEPGDYETGEDENGVHIVRKGNPQNQFVKHSPDPIGDAAPPCRVSSGQGEHACADLRQMNRVGDRLREAWGRAHD